MTVIVTGTSYFFGEVTGKVTSYFFAVTSNALTITLASEIVEPPKMAPGEGILFALLRRGGVDGGEGGRDKQNFYRRKLGFLRKQKEEDARVSQLFRGLEVSSFLKNSNFF